MTAYRLPKRRQDWPTTSNGAVPIGELYPHLEFQIDAADGELVVRGPQRFDSYLCPRANRGRFTGPATSDDKRGLVDTDAWYRTGDRVADEAGVHVHLSRLDSWIPGRVAEPESALRAYDGVEDVVVEASTTPGGQIELVRYAPGPF
ncbi:hypothetical protein F9C11_17490 [Amycolatopsis sp. VS8301801F10]|uniref:hypothetical protein n=1 Tax=Amycolatopsis sp. VS8301801F10 TaxID=2652442 RepID=UPI0038FC5125